jgi:predicted RNase H-like HicB family nuclease
MKRKIAMLVHESEGGGFWASFPDLPGCFTQGATRDDLREHAVEAVQGHLEAMREAGKPLPDAVLAVKEIEADLEEVA